MANEEIQDEEAVADEVLGMSMPSREDEIASTEEVTGNGEEMTESNTVIIRDGDLFQSQDGILMLNILEVFEPVGAERNYKLRNFATIVDYELVSEKDLNSFIEVKQLVKLATYRDRMEEISKVFVLSDGDIFTRNGEMFLEVLTAEMLYIDVNNKEKNVIGVKYANGLVAYVDALEVKASVYRSTDQFPEQTL